MSSIKNAELEASYIKDSPEKIKKDQAAAKRALFKSVVAIASPKTEYCF